MESPTPIFGESRVMVNVLRMTVKMIAVHNVRLANQGAKGIVKVVVTPIAKTHARVVVNQVHHVAVMRKRLKLSDFVLGFILFLYKVTISLYHYMTI